MWSHYRTIGALLMLASFVANASEFHVTRWVERVDISPNGSGATVHTEVTGLLLTGNDQWVIPHDDLQVVSDFNGWYTDERGRHVKLKLTDARDRSLVDNTFYSGRKGYFIDLAGPTRFELHYSVTIKELMLVSDLDLRRWRDPDTLQYEVRLPSGFLLYHRDPENAPDSYRHAVDSTTTKGRTVHTFTRTGAVQQRKEALEHHCVDLIDACAVRVLIAHGPLKDDPLRYFCAWNQALMASSSGMDETTRQWAERVTAHAGTAEEKARLLFAEVREHVSYIDVEDHLNAFRPRDPSIVWNNRKGDCKDMANLLCRSLGWVGLNARLALSATVSHPFELDFPCLSSADHVVCLVHAGDRWIPLDATESQCTFGLPSRQIQGRTLLVLDEQGGYYEQMPIVPADSNLRRIDMTFRASGTALQGRFLLDCRGASAWALADGRESRTNTDITSWVGRSLAASAQGLQLDSILLNGPKEQFGAHGNASVHNALRKAVGKWYTSLQFVPYPHDLPRRMVPGTDLVTGEAMLREFAAHVRFPKPISLSPFEPAHVEEAGISFDLSVVQEGADGATITYRYRCPYVRISAELAPAYDRVQAAIENALKRTIVHGTD
ncbi:MAG: transglutaminase domain-containing protein [Bacteroidetes bacterium]|nr:transglutaminase domain-containing protein [Bacteroidota bacterium]